MTDSSRNQSLVVVCPQCGSRVAVAPEKWSGLRGKRAFCKACSRQFLLDERVLERGASGETSRHEGAGANEETSSISAAAPPVDDEIDFAAFAQAVRQLPSLKPPDPPAGEAAAQDPGVPRGVERPRGRESRRQRATLADIREFVVSILQHHSYAAICGLSILFAAVYGFYWLWGMSIAEPWLSVRDKAADHLRKSLQEEFDERISKIDIESKGDGTFEGTALVDGTSVNVMVTAKPEVPHGHIAWIWPYLPLVASHHFTFAHTVSLPESEESAAAGGGQRVSGSALANAARERMAMTDPRARAAANRGDPDLGPRISLPGMGVSLALPKDFRVLSAEQAAAAIPRATPQFAALGANGKTICIATLGSAEAGGAAEVRQRGVAAIERQGPCRWFGNEIVATPIRRRDAAIDTGSMPSIFFHYRPERPGSFVLERLFPFDDKLVRVRFQLDADDKERYQSLILKSLDSIVVVK